MIEQTDILARSFGFENANQLLAESLSLFDEEEQKIIKKLIGETENGILPKS